MFAPLTSGPGGSPPTQPVKGVGRGGGAAAALRKNALTLPFVPDKGESGLRLGAPPPSFMSFHPRYPFFFP